MRFKRKWTENATTLQLRNHLLSVKTRELVKRENCLHRFFSLNCHSLILIADIHLHFEVLIGLCIINTFKGVYTAVFTPID